MIQGRIVAYLGPTNTGKTHLAMERMLAHRSGMIGFPLRLLARENYDRAVAIKGAHAVALITGEEKIVPAGAHYFICTVESMPLDRSVECLAVDEIQLAAHTERGHIFTDRLLHARGTLETLFMGAETIRPLLQRLVPDIEFIKRPRLSTLTYTGYRKIGKLPPRAAVVAFSASDVYALAETIRQQRGGTAVILGALSPRTRNAQMAMYQSGDVDYLVGTDAIGMGLNMDLDHVALARATKFDGVLSRRLTPQEIAQIAGRAGRHMKNGTFGATDQLEGLSADIVTAVESHKFDALKALMWRNSDLDYRSPTALLRSLEIKPAIASLKRAPFADDHQSLLALSQTPDIMRLATDKDAVSLLWDVCQIPDFRKTLSDDHVRLLGEIYGHLCSTTSCLPTEYVEQSVARLDRIEGDIDTLVNRIAHIRTWTYVSHHGDWLDSAVEWQARTRAIEDRLSDALHERLTQRFVDKRSALLGKTHEPGTAPLAAIRDHKEVLIDGIRFGHIGGLRFIADTTLDPADNNRVRDLARAALQQEITHRVAEIIAAPDTVFRLDDHGQIHWNDNPIVELATGPDIFKPRFLFLNNTLTTPEQEELVRKRLGAWLVSETRRCLGPLMRLQTMPIANASLRGLIFSLYSALGTMPYDAASVLLKREDYGWLRAQGIVVGRHYIYMPDLTKHKAIQLLGSLWKVAHHHHAITTLPKPGRLSMEVDSATPADFYRVISYPVSGKRAIRVDRLEMLARTLQEKSRDRKTLKQTSFADMIGCPLPALDAVVADLGYAIRVEGDVTIYKERRRKAPDSVSSQPLPESPFAVLQQLKT